MCGVSFGPGGGSPIGWLGGDGGSRVGSGTVSGGSCGDGEGGSGVNGGSGGCGVCARNGFRDEVRSVMARSLDLMMVTLVRS
ncbi:hypothetical protein AXG89_34000 [Burkholderia sp. PAMC 26561]|nr:hypothetical protein AXG89_34000 [Burkholderia sp. PAMC 26561]